VSARRRLLRWANWFALVHAGLLAVVGLRYLWHYAPLEPAAGWGYAVLAYAGHLTALAYLPFLVVLFPVILVLPRPRVILPLGVALASVGLSFLVLDSLVFAENRYHLGVVTFTLLAPETWGFLALYFLVGAAIEAMLAFWIYTRTAERPARRIGRYLALMLATCFLASHLVHAWAEAHYYVPVTAFTRYLPLYVPLRDTKLQVRLGLLDRARALDQNTVAALGRPSGDELHYPLTPLRCEARAPMLNVVLVVIDAMRADALTPQTAPRLSEFALRSTRFDRHYSGGNSSRAGMFSLFYGLPATYWEAFAGVTRPPVLMDLFRQHGYQLGLFSSAPVYYGVGLDRTALSRIPNLRLQTGAAREGSSLADPMLTDEWRHWLDRRDPSHPFFGFLYYNAAVALSPPDTYPPVLSVPPGASAQLLRYARYLTAVHFVDSLFGRVLDDLERRKLLDRTAVIVTSDHGMEFDETGLGFTGHGTSFSGYQMQTPLVVYWPGRPPGRVARRTSHNDVAPTLVGGLFGCTNPPSDYASGHDLFSESQWDWLIAAGYSGDFAVIEPERVTIIYPAGYEVRDRGYRLVPSSALPRDRLRAVLQEMTRFYR
jgi:membrane-anchored protein YejM (alkaline phosphatase superfamily)